MNTAADVMQNIETQYTVGLANDAPVTFISVGESNTDHLFGFLDLVNYLLSQSDPPPVLVIGDSFLEEEFTSSNSETQLALYVSDFVGFFLFLLQA